MIDEVEIRKMVINGDAEFIRDLLIPKKLVEELKSLYCQGEFTAAMLSDWKDISIQNASSRLAKHYRRGYLDRRLDTAESGGIEYVYFSPWWIRNEI